MDRRQGGNMPTPKRIEADMFGVRFLFDSMKLPLIVEIDNVLGPTR